MNIPVPSAQSVRSPAAASVPGRAIDAPPAEGESLEHAFCRVHHCSRETFLRRAFWTSLHPHAWPVARLMGFRADLFAVDRALLSHCGRRTTLAEVEVEVKAFSAFLDYGFLRRRCHLRMSGHRLKRFAARYLPPR